MYKIIFVVSLLLIITITSAATTKAEWQVDLEVYTPDNKSDTGKASNSISLGNTTTATEQYDNRFDTIALLTDNVNAYFYHPEYKSNVQRLWRDFRSDVLPQEWEFEVQSSKTDNLINIDWKIQAPANLHFVLVDKDSGNETDMSSANEYAYNANATTPKKFLLKVTDNNSSTSTNNSNVISGGGNTGAKGGGCGYIKDIGGNDNDSRNNNGHIAMSMIILLLPLLLPIKHYIRYGALAVIKRQGYRK